MAFLDQTGAGRHGAHLSADFRFVHAADLHLGAPFVDVSADDERVAAALVAATYRALERVVELCIERDADFLVLAGDVFDEAAPDLRPQLLFQRAMQRLDDAGVRVFVARGNHDPADGRDAGLRLPDNVHAFATDEVERVVLEREGECVAALYGRGYAHRSEKANLAKGFHRSGDPFAIGVLHTNVGGREGHEDYAPCAASDLAAAGMDYWALGHIHKAETVSDNPLAVYPGTPQGLNPRETGSHGCCVVDVRGGSVTVERVPLAAVTWASDAVDVSAAEGVDGVVGAVTAACVTARSVLDPGVDGVVLRLELTGRSDAHRELTGQGCAAIAKVVRDREAEMAGSPWVWIDRLQDRTSPALDLDRIEAGETFLGDLLRSVSDLASDADAARALIDAEAGPVRTKLGRGFEVAGDPGAVLDRVRTELVDRFAAGEDRR